MLVLQAQRNDHNKSIADILDRAEHQRISLDELDFLLFSLRKLSARREAELQRLQALLLALETRRQR
jgi:hypothetical protein